MVLFRLYFAWDGICGCTVAAKEVVVVVAIVVMALVVAAVMEYCNVLYNI